MEEGMEGSPHDMGEPFVLVPVAASVLSSLALQVSSALFQALELAASYHHPAATLADRHHDAAALPPFETVGTPHIPALVASASAFVGSSPEYQTTR